MLLYAAIAFEALGYGAIFALLADLQDEYHLPTYGLGLIAGSSFLALLVAQVGLARYSDRGHTRLMLRLGLAVAAVGMLWFGLASQLWEFVGARVLLGLGSGMFIPATRRVAVSRAGPNSGEVLGRLTSFEVGGFICGPPVAAALAALFGLHAPFLVLAAALAITSPAVARIAEPPVHEETHRDAIRMLFRIRGVRAGLLLAAALYLSIGVFEAIWARYLSDLGADTTVIAVSLTVFALPLVFLSPRGGRLADRRGPLGTGVAALVVTVPIIVLYGVAGSHRGRVRPGAGPLHLRLDDGAVEPGCRRPRRAGVAHRRGPGPLRRGRRRHPPRLPRSAPPRSTARPGARRCGSSPRPGSRA